MVQEAQNKPQRKQEKKTSQKTLVSKNQRSDILNDLDFIQYI